MPAGRSGGKGQDSGEWALISSRDVRVPGVKVRAGDRAGTPERSQACFLPFTSWGSWTRGPFGQRPVSLAEPVLPWEGVLSLCKQGGWSHSPWPTLQNSSLEKNYSLSRAEHGFPQGTPPHYLGCMTGSDRGPSVTLSEAENHTSPELPTSSGFLAGCCFFRAPCLLAFKGTPETQFLAGNSQPVRNNNA